MQQICHQHSYFKIKCDWLTSPSAIGGNLPSLVVSDPWARHIQNESFSVFFVIWLFLKKTAANNKDSTRKEPKENMKKTLRIWLNFLRQFFPLNFPPPRWQDESSGTFCWCLFAQLRPLSRPRPLKQTHNMLLSNILAYKIIVSPDDAGASPWGTTTKSHRTLFEHSKQ